MTKKQVKLKTGSDQEAFDLKGAMTPVTGEGKTIDLSVYETVKSKDGHAFYVFGESGGIRISLRMWKEASEKGTTVLGFRMRFGDMLVDGKPVDATTEDFKALVGAAMPWTSSAPPGTAHRSIAGTFHIPEGAWDSDRVIEFSNQQEFPALVYARLTELVVTPINLMPAGEFRALWNRLIQITLADVFKPAEPEAKSSLHWGTSATPVLRVINGTVMPYIGSKVVVPSKATESKVSPGGGEVVPAVKPANPVAHPKAFVAPHPKDAAKAVKTGSQDPAPV